MYFLVYLVPATGGSGFGVFCVVMIALAMLIAAAQFGMTWLVAPAALGMALLESGSLWWVLLILAAVGVVINLVSAKVLDGYWQPLLTAGVLAAAIFLFFVGALILEVFSGRDNPWYAWVICIVALPLLTLFVTLFFYSQLNTWVALTSPATLWLDRKPCLGALCSLGGMIGAALCLQGLIEGVVGWFGESSFLDMVRAHVEPGALKFLTFDLVSEEKNIHILRRTEEIVNAIARIPAWWRCLLGLGLAIGCGVGEFYCSNGDALF